MSARTKWWHGVVYWGAAAVCAAILMNQVAPPWGVLVLLMFGLMALGGTALAAACVETLREQNPPGGK